MASWPEARTTLFLIRAGRNILLQRPSQSLEEVGLLVRIKMSRHYRIGKSVIGGGPR